MDLTVLLMHGWASLLMLAVGALIIGSFLNVVIYRLPLMLDREWRRQARQQLDEGEPAGPVEAGSEEAAPKRTGLQAAGPEDDAAIFNLFLPRSHCPACGQVIRAAENIPIASWLALRGLCSNCGAAISPRYPVVEAASACAVLVAVAAFGWTGLAAAAAAYTCALIALACIDFDTRLLPDQLTLPLLWAGLLTNALGGFTDLASAVLGAAGAYLFLWTVYWAFKWLTGKEGMGYGDFKLFAAIGAWLGWTALPAVLLIAASIGLAYALVSILRKRRTRYQPLPFGPFLAIAGWGALVFRELALGGMLPY